MSESSERPVPQPAERVIDLTETRKALDSFNPSAPVPVEAQMVSMQVSLPGGGGDNGAVTPQAQAPMDADG